MNKLKLLYDVARTMKTQEKLGGLLLVNVRKDREEVFTLRNAFEKDEAGKGKASVSSELHLDGKHVTRESSTEFSLGDHCHGPGFMRRLFHRQHREGGCGGIKGMFSRLSVALGILSSIQVEELENGGANLSLNLSDLPEEMRETLREKLQKHGACCTQHRFLDGCNKVETLHGTLAVTVNEARVIQNVTVQLDGTLKDDDQETHTLTASGEIQLAW